MAFSQRLFITVWLSSLSLIAVASVVDMNGLPPSYWNAARHDLVSRQTDGCPDDGDCDCTEWGADCDITDWSWIDCTSFPDACASAAPPIPTVGPIQCAPGSQSTYKKCWNDIHADSVDSCASQMAVQLPNGNMTSSSPNITQILREGANGAGSGGHGVVYRWIPGCSTYTSLPADNPLGHSGDNTENYQALIKSTYTGCTGNSGLGGFVDVGCLRYGFYPNDIPKVFASPPHPELFWNVYPNICGS